MSKKALFYTKKNGEKVAVWERPIAGQLRFVPKLRTAIDGKEWWCVYDNEDGNWAKHNSLEGKKWKMKLEVARAIAEAIDKREIPYVQYEKIETPFKRGKHKFTVDVHWDVAREYEVEAESREEAQRIIQEKIDRGDVCVWTDGFEATDDVEVTTSGEEMKNGEIVYF